MSDIPENIIVRYFQNQASITEIEQLNQWLNENEDHVRKFYQMQAIWDSGRPLPQTLMAEKWDSLYAKIQHESDEDPDLAAQQEPISFIQRFQFIRWMQYAAVFTIGFFISVWWYQQRTDLPEQVALLNHVVYNLQGSKDILLPDQSLVWLSENSQITYPEQFVDDKRLVSLTGKAYFDIQKMEKDFIVQTENIEIKVTGTEFQVDNSTEDGLTVSLVSGSIDIQTKNESGKQVSFAQMTAGQQAHIRKDGTLSVDNFNSAYVLAWKDGSYRFTNEPIANVIDLISIHYQVKIRVSEKLKGKHFTGKITPDLDLDEVMKIIDMSHPIKYEVTSDGIYISEK